MNVRICGHCGAENDLTRVYCANCGARLPEETTALATAPAAAPAAAPAMAAPAPRSAPPLPGAPYRRRAPVSTPPKGGKASSSPGGFVFSQLIVTALIGAVLAALIQMARLPDLIPVPVPRNAASASETLKVLRECSQAASMTSWTVNGKAVNEYLATTIIMQPTDSTSLLKAEFQRVFVMPESGWFEFGMEQKFFGLNLYFLLRGVSEKTEGGMTVRWVGGAIGRLPVHPRLLGALQILFRPTFQGLEQVLPLLANASAVEITPADVTIRWSGATPSGR